MTLFNKCPKCGKYSYAGSRECCTPTKYPHQPQPGIVEGVPPNDRGGHGTHDPQLDFLTARGGVR